MEEPRVIKRYRNRKLYDTTDSCYVILEDIAELVRQGIDIKVIENSSGEDITSVTLAQIIFEEEKRKKETLPLTTLIQLIRSGGETIRNIVQRSIGGGVKEIHHVKDEIQDHLERLIKRGAISQEEGSTLINNIKRFIESKIRPTVENVQKIPSVQLDIKGLKKKISSLEEQLNSYTSKRDRAGKRKKSKI